MRKSPPHSFTLFGHRWRVIYKDPLKVPRIISKAERRFYQTHPDQILAGITIASRTTGRRDIFIHPSYRTDWRVFAHELLHALHFEMEVHRGEPGWSIWSRAKWHKALDQYAIPLGAFLCENDFSPPDETSPQHQATRPRSSNRMQQGRQRRSSSTDESRGQGRRTPRRLSCCTRERERS